MAEIDVGNKVDPELAVCNQVQILKLVIGSIK